MECDHYLTEHEIFISFSHANPRGVICDGALVDWLVNILFVKKLLCQIAGGFKERWHRIGWLDVATALVMGKSKVVQFAPSAGVP